MADVMQQHDVHAAMQWFEQELAQVHDALQATAAELRSPLSDLVRMQVEAAHPLVRAAVVLVAAYRPPDSAAGRSRRVALASALEMLHVALSVHGLLLAGEPGEADLDRSLIGSTILAGDYCFSRAAQLAAQTDSPRVVGIFAEALKEISEMQLRHLFEPHAGAGKDQAELLIRSGILGAAQLSRLTPRETNAILAGASGILGRLDRPTTESEVERLLNCAPPVQRAAWDGLMAWLAAARRMDAHPLANETPTLR